MTEIESSLQEQRRFYPSADFSSKAKVKSMEEYFQLCEEAENDYEHYWASLAKTELSWRQDFTKTLNQEGAPFFKWFEDGKLNASFNCLDRNIQSGLGEKLALIFEGDDGKVQKVSYGNLLKKVCKFANGLKRYGFKKGDKAIIYMPMSIEGIVAMQACARLGIIHSVVFGGFSAKSLQERIIDISASLIITADEQKRGGKSLPLKKAVDEALSFSGSHNLVKKVIIYQRTGARANFDDSRDVFFEKFLEGTEDICEPEWVEAEHPLFVLYTSGSTGKPKGIEHSTAGYLLHSILTMKYTFDIKLDDIFWCTADIGWITGHTYVAYGPLAVGATQVVFEGVPVYPNAGRFWDMIKRHKVSIFYTAPTAIRSLLKMSSADDNVHPSNYDLSSLRLLGTVGEPINPAAWIWYYEAVGSNRCPIVDTFWQTETGGHIITPLPGATPLVPGSCTLPFPGIDVDVVSETGEILEDGKGGLLVIKKPWPSMIRGIWGDPERFKKTYFPADLGGRFYLAGDGCVRNKSDRYFKIMGRIDDVLNVSGHRLGTMEIESALVSNSLVAEAAVVGREDDLSGEAIIAFVVLKGEKPSDSIQYEKLVNNLVSWVSKEIGPIAKPKEIRFGDNLPKTRSGKIMRRLLRDLAKGVEVTQDISTLENPAILNQFRKVK
ncbi:MAG: acetate--CoA ligase [Betaproteobacteria bacterium TMED82]|nr:MAG: acetate--CoA ligase [Betaproteobacteria bacterium TMED82]|tara:strand:+ start:6470 stop:8458 length:1989 start_codon:yes stop_codon:yes gene_type:complete